jgi:hypothetical protein
MIGNREILEQLSRQMTSLVQEPMSPVEDKLLNAIEILIAVVQTILPEE